MNGIKIHFPRFLVVGKGTFKYKPEVEQAIIDRLKLVVISTFRERSL